MMSRRFVRVLRTGWILLALLALATACSPEPARELGYDVVARYPHDTRAFTQGLLWHDGELYESTGLYGESSLRRIDLDTGEVLDVRYLEPDVFAEGLARIGDQLVQLTWRAGEAYRWPVDGFATRSQPTTTYRYAGEGWGLCFDGEQLVMSDGSDTLTFRDPTTFEATGRVSVTLDGEPLERLNELECTGDHVWANVWFEDRIVRIDPKTGHVNGWLDLSEVLPSDVRNGLVRDAVLNGIAWRPETETMLVTGKLWPQVIELTLDPAGR